MVSGKYSALSGAVTKEQALGNVASNLANVNTTGFKKDRISFAAILRGAKQASSGQGINFSRIRKIGTDFSQGGMQPTDRPLDVAIDGQGFFKIQKNNEIFFTRAGRLMLDENGMVKTPDGFNVLGASNEPLQLDTSAGQDIIISEGGNISINGKLADGKIQVFSVNDQGKLIKTGNSLYKLGAGSTDQPMETFHVVQGSLETSNINMMEEMSAMIATQRAFDANNKVFDSYATIDSKLDELGSIG
jgi:flagellar basal-body rod protein FlgF/flagellar basal-body rod protein FlgG